MLGRFRPRHTCECRDCGSQGDTRRWRRRVEQRESRDEADEEVRAYVSRQRAGDWDSPEDAAYDER